MLTHGCRVPAIVSRDTFVAVDTTEGGIMAGLGQKEFNARIKRINSPKNDSYYDPDLEMHIPKRTNAQEINKHVKARKFSIGKLITCVFMGVLAVIIAQGVRLRYLEMTAVDDAGLVVDAIFALFFVLFLSAVFHHRKTWQRWGYVLGAATMFLAGHNLMWAYPNELAIVYTSDYVALVRAQSEPASVMFRDFSFSL